MEIPMTFAHLTRGGIAAGLAAAALTAAAWPAAADPVDIQIIDVLAGSPTSVPPSALPSVSADGRYVAFSAGRVHVRDRQTGADVYRSDGTGFTPVLSGDGSLLVYRDTSHQLQAVTLATGAREQITRGIGGAAPNGPSANPDVSADGRFVVFDSSATNLVAGDTAGKRDVFRHDRLTGETVALSKTHNSWGNQDSAKPSVSQDGAVVAFESAATNFGGFDTNFKTDVYVRAANGTFRRASVPTGGAQANGASFAPDLDGSGTVVVFETEATNLAAGDPSVTRDVYAHNLVARTTSRISVDANGGSHSLGSVTPTISDDGSRITFATKNDYFSGDTNRLSDVYLVDLDEGLGSAARVRLVSTTSTGGLSDGAAIQPRLSGDGATVVFASAASNLVANDPDGSRMDVFVRGL